MREVKCTHGFESLFLCQLCGSFLVHVILTYHLILFQHILTGCGDKVGEEDGTVVHQQEGV